MLKKLFAVFMILFSFALLPKASLAYTSNICQSTRCAPGEVGPFMAGISQECGNSGTCSLDDIMMVVGNVGNYVTGLVGAVVLLMYTVGGIYFLTSAGNSSRLQKGKDYLKISTIGLFIVFFAYLGINTLVSVLQGGTVSSPGDTKSCYGKTEGLSCGDSQICKSNVCTSNCVAQKPGRFCIDYEANIDGTVCNQGGCPNNGYCCENTIKASEFTK